MELKRPFTEEDWQATPKPVREYIVQLEDIVIKLFKETENLKKRVSDLENRLNKNSQNSSKPPSSDPPYKKPPQKHTKGKRKRGGQKGHKGHQQKLMEPSSKISLLPGNCACGACIDPNSVTPFYTHQVIELPKIEMDVRHFILNKGSCSRCGCIVKAQLPQEYRTGYGPRLSALIAEISGIQGNSRETVRTFCKSVFGFSISSGAIQKVIDRASQALKPVHEKIGDRVRTSQANYIDETSWFQNGMLNWLWVMANKNLAYFMIHKNRSKQAFLELIQDWEGILISDNYGTY